MIKLMAVSVLMCVALCVFIAANPSPVDQQNSYLGQNGGSVYFDATPHTNTAQYCAFTVVSNCQFNAYNPNSANGLTGSMTSVTWPAGLTVFGLFTNFTLTNGCIIVYNAVRPDA